MCSIPPPPLPEFSDINESVPNYTARKFSYPDHLCTWAYEYPELREACVRNDICLYEPPQQFKYEYFESVLQQGPTCGIVALSMLLKSKINPDNILKIAQNEGYTNRGEMFSCKNMVNLAKKVFAIQNVNAKCTRHNGNLQSDNIINSLLRGCKLLVPYDSDNNHAPCLKQGHKAHWALICGILIQDKDIDRNHCYILAKHGKSKYTGIWKLHDLWKSNENLIELAPKRESDGESYIVPEDGLGGEDGLKGCFIIIEDV